MGVAIGDTHSNSNNAGPKMPAVGGIRMSDESETKRLIAVAARHSLEVWGEPAAMCPGCGVQWPASHEAEHEFDCDAMPGDDEHDEYLPPIISVATSWWWWCCSPGCLPESSAMGPYETALEALEAATDGLEE